MTSTEPRRARVTVRSESGSILVLTALVMVALLGVMALAVDASFLFTERNRMSAVADAAATAAAIEHRRSASANLQAFADNAVASHGFDPGVTTTVRVDHPPVTGSFAGDARFVEVTVSRPTNTYFASVINAAFGTITPQARAVAGATAPPTCLVTLQDLTLGNATLGMNGCDVSVGGNLHGSHPNAGITGVPTPGVSVTGSCIGTCGAMGHLQVSQPVPSDPLAGLPSPVVAGACGPAAVDPLPPGCYTSVPTSVTTLLPGTFKVTGTMDVDHLTGSDVLIYLTASGSIVGHNNGSLTLTAGTAAPHAGIAIYGDAGSTFDANNNFTMAITGAVYMPGSAVDFKNSLNLGATGCSIFVMESLQIRNGNGALQSSGCGAWFGQAAYLGVALAE